MRVILFQDALVLHGRLRPTAGLEVSGRGVVQVLRGLKQ